MVRVLFAVFYDGESISKYRIIGTNHKDSIDASCHVLLLTAGTEEGDEKLQICYIVR